MAVSEAAKAGPRDAARVARRLQDAKESLILDLHNCCLMKIPDAIYLVLKPYPVQVCLLSQNQLQKVTPRFPRNFQNLVELDLSVNLMTDLPEEMSELSALQVLNISKNRFSTIPAVIYQLLKLSHLNASHNIIPDVDGDSLDRVPSLVEVDLRRNMMSQEVMSRLRQCKCTVHTDDIEQKDEEEPMEDCSYPAT